MSAGVSFPEGVRDKLPHMAQLPAHGALRLLRLVPLLLLLGGTLRVLRCARCAGPRAEHAAPLVSAARRPPGRHVGAPAQVRQCCISACFD